MPAKAAVKKKSAVKPAPIKRVPLPPPEFGEALADALRAALQDFSKQTLAELIDPEDIRTLLHAASPKALRADAVVKHVLKIIEQTEALVQSEDLSVDSLIDKKIRKQVMSVLEVNIELTDASREFIGKVMRAPFIRSLFTEVIHVTLVGFYKKINPLFGGLATKMLESQIRSFIEMFIKIILDQAVAFVVSPKNVALFTDFAREVVRLLMAEKLSDLAQQVSTEHRTQLQALVIEALNHSALHDKLRDLAVRLFDATWPDVCDLTLQELLDLEALPQGVLRSIASLIAPVFVNPSIKDFLITWIPRI